MLLSNPSLLFRVPAASSQPVPACPPSSLGRGLTVTHSQSSVSLWESPEAPEVDMESPWLLVPFLAAGQSGLGKSTLVNTLFKSQVSRKASSWSREEKIPKTVEIKAVGHGEDQARPPGSLWSREGGLMTAESSTESWKQSPQTVRGGRGGCGWRGTWEQVGMLRHRGAAL